MAHIHYKLACDDVNWQAMHDTLIADQFHNGRSVAQYRLSFENSHTVVIAYDDDKIIGTVRALSDGVCNAYIVDVWTLTAYRQQGIARQMMKLAFEQLQGQHVYLWTDDQQAFYEAIGMQADTDATGYFKVVGDWLKNS
ncbi:MAG: GNAT family N-acetyltransferase [Phototrophicaceae bacterium]